jgi:hypothetical protein
MAGGGILDVGDERIPHSRRHVTSFRRRLESFM